MRGIKFRAWNGEMEYIKDWYWYEENGVRDVEEGIAYGNHSMYNLMQYTGINDKNNREIYEGDILLIDGLTKMIVEYGEQEIEEDYGNKWSYLGWNIPINYAGYPKPDENELEVVGNKYENPELL